MKYIIYTFLFFFIGFANLKAQSPTQSFNANGIKVIFKPTLKNVINIRIYFRGGVTNYQANQAGIERLTLDATTKCGTSKYNALAFRDSSDKYGILTYGTSTFDYGYIQLNCISKYLEQGWNLFSDAVLNPVFEPGQLNLLKENLISQNKNTESNSDTKRDNLLIKNAFKNTPYAISPDGTEETIRNLTAEDLKKYYKTLLNKNRIFIVVVGNISKQDLYEKIVLSFGNISSQVFTAGELTAPVLNDNKLLTENRDLKINYIGAIMNAPELTNINYVPFRMGISGLSGNIYYQFHIATGIAYNAGAYTRAFKIPFSILYADGKDVQQLMQGIMFQLKHIQKDGLNDEWLQHIKNTYITTSYINDQSAAALTNSLGEAEILGNWEYAEDLTELVKMVTVEQVNNALNFYITGLRWAFLGNPEDLDGVRVPVY